MAVAWDGAPVGSCSVPKQQVFGLTIVLSAAILCARGAIGRLLPLHQPLYHAGPLAQRRGKALHQLGVGGGAGQRCVAAPGPQRVHVAILGQPQRGRAAHPGDGISQRRRKLGCLLRQVWHAMSGR